MGNVEVGDRTSVGMGAVLVNAIRVGTDATIAAGAVVVRPVEGRAGMGVTTAMLEFAHRYRDAYDVAWWIAAEDPQLIADPILAAVGRKEVIELRGTGAQVYTCEASPSGFAWRLKAPDAALMDGTGAEVGHHFAGPSWQASDGSTVSLRSSYIRL